jgi:hypothetical protein
MKRKKASGWRGKIDNTIVHTLTNPVGELLVVHHGCMLDKGLVKIFGLHM